MLSPVNTATPEQSVRIEDIMDIAAKGEVQGVLLRSGGWVGGPRVKVSISLEHEFLSSEVIRLEEQGIDRYGDVHRVVYTEADHVLGVTLRPVPLQKEG